MITHTVASELPVTAEQFWSEHMHGVRVESQTWPRSVSQRSSSLIASVLVRTRTVSQMPGGCKVVDQIGIDTRLRFLRPWFIAAKLVKLKHEHSALRLRYGLRGI
jgi:hypothetical protein